MSYSELKKATLERYFSRSNNMQKQAIFQVDGAVLIIAGAGSGKTTVLCNRIANMLLFGNAYNSTEERTLTAEDEKFLQDYCAGKYENDEATIARLSTTLGDNKIEAWRILAVTFTNKAASELKERLSKMGANTEGIWAATFHSTCVRILRQDIEKLNLGYKSNFTIYDSDDSLRVIKDAMKTLNISDKTVNPKLIANQISRAKDKLLVPAAFVESVDGKQDFQLSAAKQIYGEYQKRLNAANALDFDDIIMKTVQLFEKDSEVLNHWQNRFRYIMVDEYQDTNLAQYKLVSMLANKYGNLCVVGDEDQSIYRFRGATIENILSFEDEFKSKVIKLEQNYRSTETILNAANKVIANNTQRKDKKLWSDLGKGDLISINRFSTEQEEAMFVTDKIMENKKDGKNFSDNVILYRTNAQSRTFEIALNKCAIPYRIIGGVRFFERKEIKDIIAYLSVLNNKFDIVRFKRIVNEPKRNIGDATQAEIERIAMGLAISPIDVMRDADNYPTLSRKAKALVPFGEIMSELSIQMESGLDGNIIDNILELTGYGTAMRLLGDEGINRLQNIQELKSNMLTFAEENSEATLSDFLEQVALVSDMDSYEMGEDRVVLMTMHSAKGLEFDTVFMVGTEENIFPSYRSMFDPTEIEEERRLAYVAITRAKQMLYITHVKQRMLYGQTMRNKLSRFVNEIPEEYTEFNDAVKPTIPKSVYQKPKKPGYLQSHTSSTHTDETAQQSQAFSIGDRVVHGVFGEGTILSARKMGGDMLLEVAFDTVGTKKVMANFAKMTKV